MAEQQGREDSVLNYYKKLIALRKSDAYRNTCTYSTSAPAYEAEPGIMAYIRETESENPGGWQLRSNAPYPQAGVSGQRSPSVQHG